AAHPLVASRDAVRPRLRRGRDRRRVRRAPGGRRRCVRRRAARLPAARLGRSGAAADDSGRGAAAQVIMMTAVGQPEVVRGALALGVYSIVNKPFELQALASLVAEAAGATKKTH